MALQPTYTYLTDHSHKNLHHRRVIWYQRGATLAETINLRGGKVSKLYPPLPTGQTYWWNRDQKRFEVITTEDMIERVSGTNAAYDRREIRMLLAGKEVIETESIEEAA